MLQVGCIDHSLSLLRGDPQIVNFHRCKLKATMPRPIMTICVYSCITFVSIVRRQQCVRCIGAQVQPTVHALLSTWKVQQLRRPVSQWKAPSIMMIFITVYSSLQLTGRQDWVQAKTYYTVHCMGITHSSDVQQRWRWYGGTQKHSNTKWVLLHTVRGNIADHCYRHSMN